jgi:hypothetical protein
LIVPLCAVDAYRSGAMQTASYAPSMGVVLHQSPAYTNMKVGFQEQGHIHIGLCSKQTQRSIVTAYGYDPCLRE